MKVNGFKIKDMAMGLKSLATEIFIKENISKARFMVKERWFGEKLKNFMMDNG